MADLRGVRVVQGVVLLASVVAFTWARPATCHSSSPGWAVAVSVAAFDAGTNESVPVTPPRRLVAAPEKKSGSGPALWVGAVMGVGGLAGLAFSLVNRRSDGEP